MLATHDFLVIDTEGWDELSEIAVINERGDLVYEAYNADHPDHFSDQQIIKVNAYPLAQIIHDFQVLARSKTLVCHNARHDLQVLRASFARVGQPWSRWKSHCTVKLAQHYFPEVSGYSLAELSRNLNLWVSGQPFNRQMAHAARYDAEFTYQLYRKIMSQAALDSLGGNQATPQINPFNSNRVDTPFQRHPDLKSIYGDEFQTLKAALFDISGDPNRQSHGVVVVGEPGSGKTHLMMRLAQETLRTNRLLFVRQPNNAETILFHIYSRILESLVEPVPNSTYNQLQSLIAHSIVNFLKSENIGSDAVLERCNADPLQLFESMGRAGSDVHRKNWDRLIKLIRPWWTQKYSGSAYSWSILRGIMQYCRYSKEESKALIMRWLAGSRLDEESLKMVNLADWGEELSREAFSLEAIAVLSKLSLLDEPLIIVFDQLEGLGRPQNRTILENFGDAVKEIFTHVPNSLLIFNLFPDRWLQMRDEIFDGSIIDRMSQYIVQLERPSDSKLKGILQTKLQGAEIHLDELFDPRELDDILAQPSIRGVINRAAVYYRHKVYGVALPLASTHIGRSTSGLESTSNTLIQRRLDQMEADMRRLHQRMDSLATASESPSVQQHLSRAESVAKSDMSKEATARVERVDPDITFLKDYLAQAREALEIAYDKPTIIDDNDDIGKLIAIATELQQFKSFELRELKLGKRKLPEHILLKRSSDQHVLGFLHLGGSSFASRIKNFNQLVIHHKNIQFTLMRDAREKMIKGKVGELEIRKLQHTSNGDFVVLSREDRIQLELLYKLVIDIQNKDLDITFEKSVYLLKQASPLHWLHKLLLL